jgi:hypothetical protein
MALTPLQNALALRELTRGIAGKAHLGSLENVMTDVGDVIVGGVNGSPVRVAKGSDGQIMKVVSGAPAWSASTHASTHAAGQADAITPLSIGAKSIISATETKTVHQTNPAADFTTINAALAYFANKYPGYAQGGIACTINLLSGFVMNEYVDVNGIDLGFISIVGVDSETMITRSALGSTHAAFCGHDFGVLPMINQQFNMDSSGTTGTGLWGAGIVVYTGGKVTVNSQSVRGGVKNSGTNGLWASNGGLAYAANSNFSGSKAHGVLCNTGSYVNVTGATITNSTNSGLNSLLGSTCIANNANISNSGSNGVQASYNSSITFNSGTATNCGLFGIYANSCSLIDATSANVAGALGSYGIVADGCSIINAGNAFSRKGVSNSSNDTAVLSGASIYAGGITGGINQTKNTLTTNGIIYQP